MFSVLSLLMGVLLTLSNILGSATPAFAGPISTYYWVLNGNNLQPASSAWQFLLGTTTQQYGVFTVGSSTAPQLLFSDNSSSNNLWAFRTTGSAFYIATSSATATSTNSVLTLDTSGVGTKITETTLNSATSSLVVGCLQTYATSTATPIYEAFTTSRVSTTTFGATATGGTVVWNYGSCPQ